MQAYFFFNDTATTEIYTLSLHDALPIFSLGQPCPRTSGLKAKFHHISPCNFCPRGRMQKPSWHIDRAHQDASSDMHIKNFRRHHRWERAGAASLVGKSDM